MRVVVADTTPICYLLEIQYLDLLPRLFGTIFIPTVVYGELQHPVAPPEVRNSLKPPANWLSVVPTVAVTVWRYHVKWDLRQPVPLASSSWPQDVNCSVWKTLSPASDERHFIVPINSSRN